MNTRSNIETTTQEIKNLYVISYGTIGDFLMLLYFLEGFHGTYPDCTITIITTRNEKLLREIAALHPYVSITSTRIAACTRIFIGSFLQKNLFIVPPTFHDVPHVVRLLARALTVGRGTIVGFSFFRISMQSGITIPFNTHIPFYQNLSALLKKLGCEPNGVPRPALPQDVSMLAALGGQKYVAIAPFAANASRSLPSERWIALLAYVSREFPGLKIALLGGPGDRERASELLRASGRRPEENFCSVSFAQTATLITHAQLFIGVDSGLTHVAGVLERPSVVIGNLSNPTWLPRYNQNATVLTESKNCLCTGEKGKDCFYELGGVRYLRCMIDIRQESIEKAVRTMLGKTFSSSNTFAAP